jgi:archaellum component FlaC
MHESAPQKRFDYDSLDEATRELVQRKANETHGLLKRTAENILRIGQNLRAVKEKLPHGQFLLWIETEFEMSQWTARNFIHVAEKMEDTWRNFHDLPVSVLYELAAPSTSEEILTRVQEGKIPPTLEAVKAAKEAERQARVEAEQAQRHLSTAQEEIQEKQRTIEQLTHEITSLQEQIADLSAQTKAIKEVEKVVVPPEIKAHIETLHQQVHTLKEQRDVLARQVAHLSEEAKAAAQKSGEGEQARRIRLNWYKVTSEFHSVVVRLLAQWPSPLDALAFEADDWMRLSHTKELAQRFLAACTALAETRIVESIPTRERTR